MSEIKILKSATRVGGKIFPAGTPVTEVNASIDNYRLKKGQSASINGRYTTTINSGASSGGNSQAGSQGNSQAGGQGQAAKKKQS